MPQRRQVLPEKEYRSALSEIVERDYYPDNVDLSSRILQETSDHPAVVRRVTRLWKDIEASLDQEEAWQETQAPQRTQPRPLCRETLTNFHARATSEDNADFEAQQAQDVLRARQERAVAYQVPPLTNRSSAMTPSWRLASDDFDASPHRPVLLPASTTAKSKDNEEITDRLLMPPPPRSQETKESTLPLEYVPKSRQIARIVPHNTRFPLAKRKRSISHLEDTRQASTRDASTDDDDSTDLDDFSSVASQASRRRQRHNERLIRMTPQIHPSASPLVTWGRVAGTPLLSSAAQAYLQRQAPAARSRSALGSALRQAYTPSISRLSSSARHRRAAPTPVRSSQMSSAPACTDGLLKLK